MYWNVQKIFSMHIMSPHQYQVPAADDNATTPNTITALFFRKKIVTLVLIHFDPNLVCDIFAAGRL